MKPRCPKCRGSFAYDERRVTYEGESGDLVERSLTCTSCGYFVCTEEERPLVFSARASVVEERDTDVTEPVISRSTCRVSGCTRTISRSVNQSGLCSVCFRIDYSWRRGNKHGPRSTPSPFIPHPDTPGVLIHNPTRKDHTHDTRKSARQTLSAAKSR